MKLKQDQFKLLWRYGQWLLLALFLWLIGRRGWALWKESDTSLDGISWGTALCGIPVILLSWLSCVWFWRRLIVSHGEHPPWIPTSCAHYCGQLGKYVPGKGMVLLIRANMVKPYGVPLAVGVATATYETLLSMGAGLLLAVCLLPIVLPKLTVNELTPGSMMHWMIGLMGTQPILLSVSVLVVTFACLPLISWLMNRVAAKMVKLPHHDEMQPMLADVVDATDREIDDVQEEIKKERVRSLDLAAGILVCSAGWAVQSLALGIVLVSMGVTGITWSDWVMWSMAYSLATVIGFLAIFAPGGIGVREGILFELLKLHPSISNQQALAAALLLRILMFLSDLLSGLVCSYVARWYRKRHLRRERFERGM